MPSIIFIELSGLRHLVDAQLGRSIMQVAVDNGIPFLASDCGGCCMCGACHAYIDLQWRLPPPSMDEGNMLNAIATAGARSRLTCQVRVTSEIDGLIVREARSAL